MDKMGNFTGKIKQMSQNVTAQVRDRVASTNSLPDHLNTEQTDLLYSHYQQLGITIQNLNNQIRDSLATFQKLSNSSKDVASFIHEQAQNIQKIDLREGTEKLAIVQTTVSNTLINELMNAVESQLLRPFMREQQADQETKRFIQEALSAEQVADHLYARNDRRETVIAQAILAYIESQQNFYREVSNLFGDLSSVVGPLTERLKKGPATKVAKTQPVDSQVKLQPSTKQMSQSPVPTKVVSPQVPVKQSPPVTKQTPPPSKQTQPEPVLFSASTNDLLGDFAPSKPRTTVPPVSAGNGPSLFDFDDPIPATNGQTFKPNTTPDFFSSPTPAPKSDVNNLDIFASPPTRPSSAPKSSNSFFDLDLQPQVQAQAPLQGQAPLQAQVPIKATPIDNSDPFAMFGVPQSPSKSASRNAPQANATVVSGGVHPSFYNDHEEDKAKVKVVDRRPKEATDENSVQQRIEEKIIEIRARENQKEKESEARRELDTRLTARIDNWAGQGRKGNLRSLISTLHLALWEDSGWKEMPMSTLIDPNKLKLGYRKALLIVHPDKQADKPLEQRFIAERVFELLTEAYKSEESIH